MTAAALPDTPAAWHSRVWELSWPVVAANATIPLVGLVDTAVMGRLPDPAYIGAVAVGATIFNALYWLFGFLRMGTTGLAAQALGARDSAELLAVVLRGASLALMLGSLAVLLQSPLAAGVFHLFEASERVEALAGTYFTIRIWSAPALMLHLVILGVLFGTQRMRAAFGLSVLLNVTNIVLDLLLVLGLGWGVAGVASATLVSEWLAAGVGSLLLWRVFRRPSGASPWPDRQRLWRRAALARLFSISGNLMIRAFFVQLPFFVFTLLGARLGDLTLAANAVVMQIFLAMAFILDGPAHTAETLCGYAFGAGDRRGLRDAARYTLLWALGLAVVLSGCIPLFGEPFIGLLTTQPEVRSAAGALLPWAVAGPLLAVWAFLLDGIYIGTTQTSTLRNTMFLSALAFAAVLWLGLDTLGNQALWLAMMVFMIVRGILLGVLFPRIERRMPASTTTVQQPSTGSLSPNTRTPSR